MFYVLLAPDGGITLNAGLGLTGYDTPDLYDLAGSGYMFEGSIPKGGYSHASNADLDGRFSSTYQAYGFSRGKGFEFAYGKWDTETTVYTPKMLLCKLYFFSILGLH